MVAIHHSSPAPFPTCEFAVLEVRVFPRFLPRGGTDIIALNTPLSHLVKMRFRASTYLAAALVFHFGQ